VKILTYNILCHWLVIAPNKAQRLQTLIEKIESYDIVCIQELFTLGALRFGVLTYKNWIISEANKKGFLFYADSPSALFGQDSGLLILSKLPITSSDYMVFNHWSWTEGLNAKGAIQATIDYDGVPLNVVTLHCDAHGAQLEQIQELSSSIQQDESCLVCGDFNIAYGTSGYDHITRAFAEFEDVFHDDASKRKPTHMNGCTLDHIFVSKTLKKKFEVVNPTTVDYAISDHIGVSVTLKKKSK
jgi:endonuclease/exonuclease/phosphatase family metal-dependent hydrolase